MTERTAESAWQRLRARRGVRALVAQELGLRFQTLDNWTRVPIEHVFAVSSLFRVAPELLRPDFFHNDPLRQPRGNTVSA